MESKLARQQKSALFEAVQRLTPEQRLEAFLAHCRLLTALYQAGLAQRSTTPRQRP